jgi:L-iditol 2-dehydrogenase
MKALVKYASGDGNVEMREIEELRCGDNQVKLEIAYCGICGTDPHVLQNLSYAAVVPVLRCYLNRFFRTFAARR